MIDDMREQVELLKANPEKEFSQAEFRIHRLFPWAIDSRTWGKIIHADIAGENILKTRIEGEGYTKRYLIKGKNIIKYINKYGQLMMSQVRNPKHNGKKNKKESGAKKGTQGSGAK